MAAKKGQGREVRGWEAKKKGPKPKRYPKGEDWLWTHSPIALTLPPTETPTHSQIAQAECPHLQGRRATLPRQIFYPSLRAPIWVFALGAESRRPSGLFFCYSCLSHQQVWGARGKTLFLSRPLLLCEQARASSLILQGPPRTPGQQTGMRRRIIAKAKGAATPQGPQVMGGKELEAGKGRALGL